MTTIYQDLLRFDHDQYKAYISSLELKLRAQLHLLCPDIVRLARCRDIATKDILPLEKLCASLSTNTTAVLRRLCSGPGSTKVPWSPLALAVTATMGMTCAKYICRNSQLGKSRTVRRYSTSLEP